MKVSPKKIKLEINENEFHILNYIVNNMKSEVDSSIKENLGEHWIEHYASLWMEVQNKRCELYT